MSTRPADLAPLLALLLLSAPAPAQEAPSIKATIDALNAHHTVAGSTDPSYKVIFDAYLKLDRPPFPVGEAFNHNTIHPKMKDWARVAGWAESNAGMAQAIIDSREKTIIGLPYGRAAVPPSYVQAGVLVDVGVGGSLRTTEFPYLQPVQVICAFCTAEIYRRMEAGAVQPALELALAELFVLRQFCDREFLDEKVHHITLLSQALQNLRDIMYAYQDRIPPADLREIAWWEIPFLRPDRNRLLMPEADRMVSERMIDEVFDAATGNPDEERFADAFAGLQTADKPLTRFGAARRWKMIARVHSSLDASRERLRLVYDDWWRRWRVEEYDPILDIPSQFERTNPIRYAAVISSMQDIEALFSIRHQLIANVNATAIAAGLCAYKQTFNAYPSDTSKIRQFARKISDSDPYHREFGPFEYRLTTEREPIDTVYGRLWVEPGQALLYSKGHDLEDSRAREHTDDGFTGDIVVWPPIKSLARAQGLMK
jgi:hypothetical protein